MINNRQAGRRRGRGGQQQRPQGNSGARDNGNRIDNRSRGNAAQLLEKYKLLARDAQMSGDRVNTEYYLQFADHYFRVLAETRSRFEENRTPMQGGANTFQDDEQDYNDEGEPVARAEQPRQNEGRQDGNRQDGNRQDGERANQGRQQNGQNYQADRQNGGSRDGGQQQDRQQRDRPQQDRSGEQRVERGQYDDDRPRRQDTRNDTAGNGYNRNVDAGGNGNGNGNGNGGNGDQAPDRYVRDGNANRGRYQNEDRAPVQQEAAPRDEAPRAEASPVEEQQEAPRRRGRPRREPVAEAPAEFEADRLPPSLNISALTPPVTDLAPANDEAEEKPRRRRGRPPASEAPAA